MLSPTSPIPLYHQISGLIRGRIEDGYHPVGSALPPEEELAQEFRVARATIRQAIGELVHAGLIHRRRGSGTFVLPTAGQARGQRFRGSLLDLLRETRRTDVAAVDIQHRRDLPPRVTGLLRLKEPTGTIVRRVHTMDQQPLGYTVNYLPEAYGRLLTEDELRATSLMWTLASRGVKLSGGTQTVRALLADLLVSDALGIPYGSPVLYVERLILGPRQRPVELAQTWYRGDTYEYTVEFELTGSERNELRAQLT